MGWMMKNSERSSEALKKIAAKLRILRRDAGLGQKEVSAATGLNIGRLEAGSRNITLSTLNRLCEYYGTTIKEFFRDVDL